MDPAASSGGVHCKPVCVFTLVFLWVCADVHTYVCTGVCPCVSVGMCLCVSVSVGMSGTYICTSV